MVTWADVGAIAADVATAVPNAAQTIILAFVDGQLDAARWGTNYQLGACLLCAHYGLGVARGISGESGPIASESVGGVSVSYASLAVADDLDTTPYGRLYRRLARQVGAGGFVAGG